MAELESEFAEADGMVLVSYSGLETEENEELRGKLAEKGVRFRMVRNTLAKRVLAAKGFEFPESEALKGNTGIAYGDAEAAIDAAKIFADKDVKKAGKVAFKGGVLEGNALDANSAKALADLPDSRAKEALHTVARATVHRES